MLLRVLLWPDEQVRIEHLWFSYRSAVAYFTKEVNPCSAKPPLKFNGVLAEHTLISLVKIGHMWPFTWVNVVSKIDHRLSTTLYLTLYGQLMVEDISCQEPI